jgi:hypothetical protein
MMRRLMTLAALLPLVACGAPPPYASLPRDAVEGAGDPTRAAIIGAAYAFAAPANLAGHPEMAARATANMEFLATELPYGPRSFEYNPTVTLQLAGARDEWRAALGIAAAASPQEVVDGLYAASRALAVNDRAAALAALPAPAFADGATTLIRLASLPALPRTSAAASLAERELIRIEQDGKLGNQGGDGAKF